MKYEHTIILICGIIPDSIPIFPTCSTLVVDRTEGASMQLGPVCFGLRPIQTDGVPISFQPGNNMRLHGYVHIQLCMFWTISFTSHNQLKSQAKTQPTYQTVLAKLRCQCQKPPNVFSTWGFQAVGLCPYQIKLSPSLDSGRQVHHMHSQLDT